MSAARGPYAVDIKEAARLLGLHPHTIRKLIGEGRLYAVRVGTRFVIPLAAIDRFLELPDRQH